MELIKVQDEKAMQAVKLSMPLEITEHLEDAVFIEGSTAELECKVNGYQTTTTWYKDGVQINTSNKIKVIVDRNWRRIKIESITEEDSGLYVMLLKNRSGTIFSKANLQVGLKRIQTIYTCPCPKQSLSVYKGLKNITANVGQKIKLEFEHSLDVIEFVWFKGNKVLTKDDPTISIIVRSAGSTSSSVLSILCAKLNNTGLYTVVAKTKFGVVSSTAHVAVLDIDLESYHNGIPEIVENLPDKVDVNEDEEVRIICKVRYDSNTTIKWYKNGALIGCSNRLVTEEYSGDYVGLKILQAITSDSAEYSVVLENALSGRTNSSACFVTVNSSPMLNPPIVQLRRPLISAVACCCSQVSFDCSFELPDSRYYYVVWYVGHYRIERSNSRFDVICKDGEFLLNIMKLEPSMAGEVLCELRRALPNQRSVFINSASAHLAVVSPPVLREMRKVYPERKPAHHFRCIKLDDYLLSFPGKKYLQGSNENGHLEKCSAGEFLMEIKYCRLEDDNFYYLHAVKSELMAAVEVTVRNKSPESSKSSQTRVLLVEWTDPHLHTGYAIDLKHKENAYLEAGVTSTCSFEIQDPPVGKLLEFRIRAAEPLGNDSEVLISIALKSSGETETKICPLKDMKEFDTCFSNTGVVIGSGSYGSVMLVRDTEGESYAAKFLKTRTQKMRSKAQHEYDMLKELRHPKLVELIDAFVAPESFVLVMDFLWGGELFDRIVEEEHIKEVDVVPYVRQICEALEFLHRQNVCHLDLKPENIICLSPNSKQIKLVDFGLAKVLTEGNKIRSIYGTRDYVAPEVLNYEQLTVACDMWSLGVVTYVMLSGVMPFSGESWLEKSANITGANYDYDEMDFKDISDQAKDFVDRLLILSAKKRMSATEALNHRWIVEGPPKGARAGYMKRARENLKSYLANYRARWQRAGNVMIAAHRLRTQASNRSSAERASPGT